ncbi:mucin-5AC-like isoform X3 [Parus major]|uniref:mucin-5AC-like isoform X3 n=1 Tax=Parus major TaxID=9157 RepID=UPI00144479AB|nr:mucin-5AC-like isoform X3 [Parus major]
MSSSHPERGSYTVLLRQLREEDEGWYWCGARSGHTELTASLKLLIHKGTCSSWDPGTATAPSPAAPSTARHGRMADVMGTVPKDTTMASVTHSTTMASVTMGTAPKDTMASVPKDTMGTVPKDTTMGSVTHGTTMGTVPKDTMASVTHTTMASVTMASVPKDTMASVTHSSISLLPSAIPGTSATSPGEAFQERRGKKPHGEPGASFGWKGRRDGGALEGRKGWRRARVQEKSRNSGWALTNSLYGEKLLFQVSDEDLSQNLLWKPLGT